MGGTCRKYGRNEKCIYTHNLKGKRGRGGEGNITVNFKQIRC
jgi:hypothetical protein